MFENTLNPILFLPHGGGPLPLLGDPDHQPMVDFLTQITPSLGHPSAILLISAHWEEDVATITYNAQPPLIYDYFGFPPDAYQIRYTAPGAPALAEKIHALLSAVSIASRLDPQRGFDHGMFVPLKIMYPEANIPCVQLSLINTLDPESHIAIGAAISALRRENILILGSGFSFHNLRALTRQTGVVDEKNYAFEHWLAHTCTDVTLTSDERTGRLIRWETAPHARYCHPREEHLLPLHVCYGAAKTPAKLVFNQPLLGKLTSAYLW